MNIKSLLLGSAAALVAVTGARAADAVVVAEPEPVEYVRVCDVYGSGFFYLPGTETCLKIGGYVRVDLRGGDFYGVESAAGDETYNNRVRFQLRADARSETEFGTLRSYAAINFNYQVSGSGTTSYDMEDGSSIEHAYIELGGFRIGKTDSYFSTFTDYSSGVMNDGIVPYGPFGTLQIAYTYTGANGFSAGVAIEQGDNDDAVNYTLFDANGDPLPTSPDTLSGITGNYGPYVVGGLSFTQGWGKIGVVAGYDSWQEEVAVKGRLDINITDTASVFVMAAWDSGGDKIETNAAGTVVVDNGSNYYAPWGGDWAIWGGTAIKLNEKATFNAEIGYDDFEDFSVAANVAYELVPGFTITPEVVYADNFGDEIVNAYDNAWGFNLRFQRNF
ncbi:porin [Mesorhizobium sp. IMUNJ 23232]|uniref:porin n=1 Tax=Mesorhizobium sp. IMUNJ 23232 TaxID=3376064 RepID=UPI003789DEB6